MFCEQKTPEQMLKDSELATKTALEELKMHMEISQNTVESQSSNDTVTSSDENVNLYNFEDSDDDSLQEEIVLRKTGGKQKHNKTKENSIIFMFSKYEKLQRKNREYKTKLLKLESKLQKSEDKEHYKNLDLANNQLQISNLQDQLDLANTQLKLAQQRILVGTFGFITLYTFTLFLFSECIQHSNLYTVF